MTKKQTSIITFLTLVVFILAFLVSGRLWFRLDMTRNKAYTISRVSRNLHLEIPDSVSITYYVSDRLRNFLPAPSEIEDMLREYAAYSRGKITVTVRDPIRAGLASVVEEFGLMARQVQIMEQDQASLATVFSGIVIEYIDQVEVLPWVVSTATLEYDLTSRIRAMVSGNERRLGVLLGDSFRQWNNDFSFLGMMFAEAGYRLRTISLNEEIPDNLPALIVLGGVEDIDERMLYRIDRYIQLGGKVLFAVNGIFTDIESVSLDARFQNDLGLLEMIASYGVIVRPEFVLDRTALPLQYHARNPAGTLQLRIIRYPFWFGVLPENGNANHPVTAGFSGVDLYWASPLELAVPQNLEANVLFTTTDQGWLMIESFYANPDIQYLFEKDAPETRGTKILAASLKGEFPSFFRGRPKPSFSYADYMNEWGEEWDSYFEELEEEELPDMPLSANPSRIIVVGNTDFATNIMSITQATQNLDFLLRAVDWLVSDDDIITIRNREPHTGRLDKITDEGRKIAAISLVYVVNFVLVPLAVVIAGITFAYKRRKKQVSAKKEINNVN